MSTESTRTLHTRLTDAYRAGDADALAALLAEDVVHVLPDSSGDSPRTGRAQAAAALVAVPDALDPGSLEREVTLAIADGDVALAKVAVNGRTTGGEPYKNAVILISTWSDGRVVRLDEVGDTLNDADQGLVTEVPAWP